ncbi:hypothetical protein BJ170DRAFT_352874 [Xylariales sp. AK1849]|nr:hypothetical protein BJ170DRAFT_352874 [Xylariales sp. AK1849]
MATDFIMPRLPDQQMQPQPHAAHFYPHQFQQSQLPQLTSQSQSQSHPQPQPQSPAPHVQQAQIQIQYANVGNSQQVSPLSTSNNASPTSPKSYHGRQVRPLYIPAVLRPTAHPSKKTSTKKSDGQEEDSHGLRCTSSFISLTGLGALGRLSRRSTGDSGKCVDGEWNLDMFPKPTAQPTKSHWKPDVEATICDEPSCMRHFNYWTRRHHCRKCGNIFCDAHSTLDIPLDQDANYNPKGTISRACSHCYTDFQVWRSRTNSQASSDDASARGSQTVPSSPIASTPTAVNRPKNKHKAEVAASVPRDWNWSTF